MLVLAFSRKANLLCRNALCITPKSSRLSLILGSTKSSKMFSSISLIGNIKTKLNDIYNDKEITTIPNVITFSRIIASPFLGFAIASNMKTVALTTCVVFGFSDWLDGYLARKLNQKTVFGAFLDPAADKVMITSICCGMVYNGLIPLSLAAIIIGRDVSLLSFCFYLRWKEKPKDSAFFDTTDSATYAIVPSDYSKINTALQFLLLTTTLSQFACGFPTVPMIEPLWWITAVTTISSGLGYLDGSGIKRLSLAGVGQGVTELGLNNKKV